MRWSASIALAVLAVALAGPLAAAPPRVDGDALMAAVKTLASAEFEGRRTGSPGGLKARTWLQAQFAAIGLRRMGEQYSALFTFERDSTKVQGANVIGLCPGARPMREVTVVSAHYDHLGTRSGAIYHGADDNASGVAVLLAMARHCLREPLQHDTIFAAFDAEELGLQGARAFLANPPVSRERLALNVNLDMVSRSDKRELYASGTFHWPASKPPLAAVAKRAPVRLLFGHDNPASGPSDDWTNQSDHGRFHAAGIPFVYFGVEDHADYHRPSDTVDKIDPAFFRDAAETILDAVIALDQALPFKR
jgi:Zn-dependent M28 family amino/carboxypeptidase